MTKSATATPGLVEGQVSTVNIEGSCGLERDLGNGNETDGIEMRLVE